MCLITSAVAIGSLSISAAVANTMLAIGAVATVASTALGVVGSVQQGKAAKAEAQYQAQVNRQNAKKAEMNAAQKRQEGIEESRLQRIRTLQKVGSQQAAMAANGIDISSGTALDIVEDTAAMGELDALTTRYNSETEAIAFEHQAANFENQANLDILSGQNAYKSGMINAAATGAKGLGKLTSVAGKWYQPTSVASTTATRVSGGISGDTVLFS